MMCDRHWDALRRAVEARGLWPLVACGPTEVMRRMQHEVTHGPSRESFDPMMEAYSTILCDVIEITDREVLQLNDDGSERCAICFLVQVIQHETASEECGSAMEGWLEIGADRALARARELGLR